MTTIQTTQLDFAQIKQSLKAYFERQSEFADYDFEASGLQNILDVLAYNTHYNALIANFALNEAYLGTAQLRSSVISKAQALGYNVRSKTAPVAFVSITANLSSAASPPSPITLPAGFPFTTSVDGTNYTFRTLEAIQATNNGSGFYTFRTAEGTQNIPIYQGAERTKTFLVGQDVDDQVYVIPDETIDTSTVKIYVYDTYSSQTFNEYFSVVGQTNITPQSRFYRINELPNGYYEVSFGDGQIYGQKPITGNKIVVEYLSTSGPDANRAAVFVPGSDITVGGTNYPLSVATLAAAAGGAEKQSIESIRRNAPLSFASQQRLVTSQDYVGAILTNYSQIRDATAWGGEENNPVEYGKVFVSAQFDDNVAFATREQIKGSIRNDLNENLAIMSVDLEFVDPVTTFLELDTVFFFNPDRTTRTRSALEAEIRNIIQTYTDNNLKLFSGTFRRSNLLSLIDNFSAAILSSSIDTRIQQRLTPITRATNTTPSVAASYTLRFPVALSLPRPCRVLQEYVVESSLFNFQGSVARVRNKLNSTQLQIVSPADVVLLDNVGSFAPSSGTITLTAFAPGVILSGETFLKFSVLPQNDAVVKPLRNYILDFDSGASVVDGRIDRNETNISL